ncbi:MULTISPECIES: hypothetical protein [Erwinia]|uniref:hypothetical protein n=1 Tax=Erwinia TaxID=551 RepID=UPI001444578B|nr:MULTISPECIES: hypothetical protein [Erwinia]MCT2388859.1 hypothetical protein [Erwinia pyrifoliae]MCU8589053.1 hypothetical protein [Erwinia pyrifoliae]
MLISSKAIIAVLLATAVVSSGITYLVTTTVVKVTCDVPAAPPSATPAPNSHEPAPDIPTQDGKTY